MATIDMTIEAPIMATEAETDPAAPAAGDGAGVDAGEIVESWAVAAAEKRATAKTTARALKVVTGAIAKGKRQKLELARENGWEGKEYAKGFWDWRNAKRMRKVGGGGVGIYREV